MAKKKTASRKAVKKSGNKGVSAPKNPVSRLKKPGWEKLLDNLRVVSTSEARADFADVTDIAKYEERIGFTRYGRLRGVAVSPKDAALLALLETPRFRKLRKELLDHFETL